MVLKLDGSEFDFAAGEVDSVVSQVPAHQFVAHLHTHAHEWAQSEVDWSSFLLIESINQAHVVTPTRTYSLHKLVGWSAPPGEDSAAITAR